MHYPPTDIQADFEINRLIRYQCTAKKILQTDGQQKVVFFKKRKNTKKNKWITRGILKSIKTKNMIYEQMAMQQTKPENTEEFETLKVRFRRFHKILHQSIQEANVLIILQHLNDLSMTLSRHGLSSMIHYNIKRRILCQVSFLTMGKY